MLSTQLPANQKGLTLSVKVKTPLIGEMLNLLHYLITRRALKFIVPLLKDNKPYGPNSI